MVVSDIYRPWLGRGASEARCVLAGRVSAGACGVLIGVIAAVLSVRGERAEFAFKIGASAGGPLLGAFLCGLLSREGTDRGVAAAMLGSAAGCLALLALSESGVIGLDLGWLPILGAGMVIAGARIMRGGSGAAR